jgi:glycosyltransferase involved in cell wall biosynthesis
VPSRQPDPLSLAIRRLLEDRVLAQQLAESGRRRVLQYHRESVVTEELLTLYRRVVAKRDRK